MRNILEFPTIRERDVEKIHKFYEVLSFNIESLHTLQTLNKFDAAVRFTFDKLGIIENELAITGGNWSKLSFVQFLEVLEKWTINNPISEAKRPKVEAIPNNKREKRRPFYGKHNDGNHTTAHGCLFCEHSDHKAIDCDKVVSVEQRKKIFLDKRLCFNCTGSRHQAEDCRRKCTCQNCHAKHHTSLCDRVQAREPGITANNIGNTAVIHPVVVLKIGGYKFRA